MSVPPNTPADWITIKIQGRKCDIAPEATVEELFEKIRHMIGSKSLQVPGGTASRHSYNAKAYGLVKKSTVGTDKDGDWNLPDGKEDLVPYNLDGVEGGDELRAYRDPSWGRPIYPEAVDGEEVGDE